MLTPNIGTFIRETVALFRRAEIDSPRLSAELLLAHALEVRREYILTHPEAIIPPDRLKIAENLANRRATGEPVAYLLGCKEFYGRDFVVNKHTLVPRPETELLIDLALAEVADAKPGLFADLGTGSGCIALTLLAELPDWQALAVDISASALAVAAQNAARLAVDRRCGFLLADMQQPLFTPGSLDLLLSNPPYISPEDYAELGKEVKEHEPKLALCSEEHGLAHLAALEAAGRHCLKAGGSLLLEIGSDQGKTAPALFERAAQFWAEATVHNDLAGLPRVLHVRRSQMC